MKQKPTPKKIGNIGSNDVMQYGDAPMLILGKAWLSAGKIKAVLANLEACRTFLVKYDAPKPEEAAAAETSTLKAQMAELQAKLAALNAQSNGHTNRLDPIQKAA